MTGQIVGWIILNDEVKNPMTHIFDSLDNYKGKVRVLDRNKNGDCLVINNNNTAMADVSPEDIKEFIPVPVVFDGELAEMVGLLLSLKRKK